MLRLDRGETFRFASLQSPAGRAVLEKYKLVHLGLESVVLVHQGRVYLYSSAVFEALRLVKGPWRGFLVFSFLPRAFTDFCYKSFARNRYRLFGKTETCRIPTPSERSRFLETIEDLSFSK